MDCFYSIYLYYYILQPFQRLKIRNTINQNIKNVRQYYNILTNNEIPRNPF